MDKETFCEYRMRVNRQTRCHEYNTYLSLLHVLHVSLDISIRDFLFQNGKANELMWRHLVCVNIRTRIANVFTSPLCNLLSKLDY
jgi:hypothetical protein